MDESEIEVIASLWNEFFPQEKFFSQDPRIAGIKAFFDFLMTPPADDIISELNVLNLNYSSPQHVYINVQLLNQRVPFSDFEFSLQQRPIEVIGSLGIALSLCVVKRKQMNPFLDTKVIIRPRLYALSRDLAFGDVKSSTVGQLISLTGHVVRVSACRPLVESAAFMCSKCMQMTTSYFEDGIFMPPSICNTPKSDTSPCYAANMTPPPPPLLMLF